MPSTPHGVPDAATPRPAAAGPLRRAARRAAARLARGVGVLLLGLGTLLVLVGVWVDGARRGRLAAEAQIQAPPPLEDTIAAAPPAAGAPAASPAAPDEPGRKRVAAGGLDVALRRVVRFGAADDVAPQPTGTATRPPAKRVGRAAAGGIGAAGAPAAGDAASPAARAGEATAAPTPMGPPDHIVIRSIDVDRPVVPIGWTVQEVDNATLRSVWDTADDAAGWHETSARPGQIGNTVISGHNNIAGAIFRRLHELAVGDQIALRAGSAEVRYAVERRFIVREEGASAETRAANHRWIEPTDDERLTLVTCYPPWGNSHRLIVIARPVVVIAPTATAEAAADGSGAPRGAR